MPYQTTDYRLRHHEQTSTSVVVPENIIATMHANTVRAGFGGCWEYRPPNASNPASIEYPNLSWWTPGQKNVIKLHRLALILSNDAPAPPGLMALHSCSNRRCVNPAHLRYGTHLENVEDRMRDRAILARTGRRVITVPMSKLMLCEAA